MHHFSHDDYDTSTRVFRKKMGILLACNLLCSGLLLLIVITLTIITSVMVARASEWHEHHKADIDAVLAIPSQVQPLVDLSSQAEVFEPCFERISNYCSQEAL